MNARLCSLPRCNSPAEPETGRCAAHAELPQCKASVTHRTGGAPTTQCGNRQLPDSEYCRLHDVRTVDAAMAKVRNRANVKMQYRDVRQRIRHLGEDMARSTYDDTVPQPSFEQWQELGRKLQASLAELEALGVSPNSIGW